MGLESLVVSHPFREKTREMDGARMALGDQARIAYVNRMRMGAGTS